MLSDRIKNIPTGEGESRGSEGREPNINKANHKVRKPIDSGDNAHQSKRQRTVTITLVAMADSNLPLKKMWELTDLKHH